MTSTAARVWTDQVLLMRSVSVDYHAYQCECGLTGPLHAIDHSVSVDWLGPPHAMDHRLSLGLNGIPMASSDALIASDPLPLIARSDSLMASTGPPWPHRTPSWPQQGTPSRQHVHGQSR